MREFVTKVTLFFSLTLPTGSVGMAQSLETESLERLAHYEIVTPRIDTIPIPDAQPPKSGEVRKQISFEALGNSLTLELEPVQLYSPGAQIEWITPAGVFLEDPPQVHFKGRVTGDDSSWARLSINQLEIEGIVRTEDHWIFMVPSWRFGIWRGSQSIVVYRLSDVLPASAPHWCAIDTEVQSADMRIQADPYTIDLEGPQRNSSEHHDMSLDELLTTLPAGFLKEAEIHVVADGSYHARHQADAASRMASVINAVTGVYEEELDVRITIGHTTVYTNETDPFTSSNDASTLLNSFTSGEPHIQGFDLAHLFTGRDLNGGTAGIAWLSTVCSNHATGLSQDLFSADSRLVLTAHEIGHNFGSGHDGTSGHGCDWGFVMWPSVISSAREFSSCSQDSMHAHIDTRSCLADVDTTPEAPTLLSPMDILTTSSPSFSWTAEANVDEYRLVVRRNEITIVDSSFSPACTGGVCVVNPNVTLEASEHSWWVIASNSVGEGPASQTAVFTVSSASPPSAPGNLQLVQ